MSTVLDTYEIEVSPVVSVSLGSDIDLIGGNTVL